MIVLIDHSYFVKIHIQYKCIDTVQEVFDEKNCLSG